VRSTSNNFIRSLDHSRDPRVCFEMFRDITDDYLPPAGRAQLARPCVRADRLAHGQPAKSGLTGGLPRLVERLFRQSPLHRLNLLHVGCKKLAPALASMDDERMLHPLRALAPDLK
jgi:hypothetical protein